MPRAGICCFRVSQTAVMRIVFPQVVFGVPVRRVPFRARIPRVLFPQVCFQSPGFLFSLGALYRPAPWTLPAEGEHSPSPTLPVQPVAESFPWPRSLTILALLPSHTATQTMMPSCVFTPGSVTFQFLPPCSMPSGFSTLTRSSLLYLLPSVAFHLRISLLPFSHHISWPHTCPRPVPPDWLVFVTSRAGTQYTSFLSYTASPPPTPRPASTCPRPGNHCYHLSPKL